jgi:DNA-binding NarL/FixJ family response regulator
LCLQFAKLYPELYIYPRKMGNGNNLRIAIADDQSIFRHGVISSLSHYSNLKIVCEAENGNDLLLKLTEQPIDVVLLDMKMPDMDGVEACKRIKRNHPEIKVIGLSVYDHYYYIASLFQAGGSGYLLKDIDPEEIVKAIETVNTDGVYFNEKTSVPLVKQLMVMEHPSVYFAADDSVPLKPYEIEIIQLIAQELTAVEISEKLELSKRTVENYKALIMAKIGAKNTAGIITYAIKKGIIVV